MLFVIGVIVAVIVLTFALYTVWPRGVARWVHRIDRARRALTALWWLLLAVVFIASGYLPLMLVGAVVLLYMALLALEGEDPGDLLRNPREVLR